MLCTKCGHLWPLECTADHTHVLRRPRHLMAAYLFLTVAGIGVEIIWGNALELVWLNGAIHVPMAPLFLVIAFLGFVIAMPILRYECSDPEVREPGKPKTWVSRCPGCGQLESVTRWSV